MKKEIKIYDIIGADFFGNGITASSVISQIEQVAEADEILVRINSIGGSVTDAIAIYNALRAKKCAGKTAIVDGVSMSAATFVLLGCDTRIAYESSILMIHNPWTLAVGNADELEKQADDLRVFEDAGKKIYLDRMSIDEKALDDMLTNETYLGAQDALAIRLVTEIDAQLSSPSTANAAALKMAVMAMGHTQGRLQEFLAKKNAAAAAPSASAPEQATSENPTPATPQTQEPLAEPPPAPAAPDPEHSDPTTTQEPPTPEPPIPPTNPEPDSETDKARACAIQSIYDKHGKNGLLSDLTVRALAEKMSIEDYKSSVIDILAENQKPTSAAVGGVSANLFRAAPKQQTQEIDHAAVYARLKDENKAEATEYFKQHKNDILIKQSFK